MRTATVSPMCDSDRAASLSCGYGNGRRVRDRAGRALIYDVCDRRADIFWTMRHDATDSRIIERTVSRIPGEDFNGNGRLEAGNIATVTPAHRDDRRDGFALIDVVYPQEYAYWLDVDLNATRLGAGHGVRRARVVPAAGLGGRLQQRRPSAAGPGEPVRQRTTAAPITATDREYSVDWHKRPPSGGRFVSGIAPVCSRPACSASATSS